MKRLALFVVTVIMLAAFSASAEAVVINFDDLYNASVDTQMTSYSSDGFSITTSIPATQALFSPAANHQWYFGSANLLVSYTDEWAILALDAGGLFNIDSMDLHNLHTSHSVTVQFFAYDAGDNQVGYQSITIPDYSQWYTINFSSDFENISYLKWQQQVPYHSFDNIVLSPGSTVVPEPASMLLTFVGLAGLIFKRTNSKK